MENCALTGVVTFLLGMATTFALLAIQQGWPPSTQEKARILQRKQALRDRLKL